MLSLTQMCKIWEKQSFMNISSFTKVSKIPKLRKMQFQQDVQNFYRAQEEHRLTVA